MVHVLNSTELFHGRAAAYWQAEMTAFDDSQRVTKRGAQLAMGGKRALNGDEVVRTLRHLMRDGFGVRRSDMQVRIHGAFIEAMLPKLYQQEWDENKARILSDYGLNKLQQEVLIVMPRRRGKTYSVAMAAAAVLLAVPNCSVAVFSTGERLARMLMEVVRSFVEKAFTLGTVQKQQYVIETDNKESLCFIGPDGSRRFLGCYPGSARMRSNLLGATPGGVMSAKQYAVIFTVSALFLALVVVVSITVPLKTSKPHYPGAPPTPPTSSSITTSAPTSAPTNPPPGPLSISCPLDAQVFIGDPLTVPPQAQALTNGSGCAPVALSYIDVSGPTSTALVQTAVAEFGNTDVNDPVRYAADSSSTYIVGIYETNNATGSIISIHNATTFDPIIQFPLTSLAPPVGPCATLPGGQGQVVYDHHADRWLLLQTTRQGAYNGLCLFISTGNDPTAMSWRLYGFTSPRYPGSPRLAIYGDLYIITTIEPEAIVYFIERQPILNLELNTRFFRHVVNLIDPACGPVQLTPVHNDAGPEPLGARSAFLMRHRDDEPCAVYDAQRDFLDVYHFTDINFALGQVNMNSSSIALPDFNMTTRDYAIPQPGGPLMATHRARLSPLIYRQLPAPGNFRQAVVGSFSTSSVSGVYSVYWFELRGSTASGQLVWSLHRNGTVSGGSDHRWGSAITMDAQGTTLLTYAKSSLTTAPQWMATNRVADALAMKPEFMSGSVTGPRSTRGIMWDAAVAMPGQNGTFVASGVSVRDSDGLVTAHLARFGTLPLVMHRQWTADDACLATAVCVQHFASAPAKRK